MCITCLYGIYAEHLKFCSRRILPLLAMCISALLIHGFLPDSMLSVVLVSVIKDKCRKINDSDNYRPIALASVISKVVEKILLNRMPDVLLTTCNQFGFKSKLGTDTCIYALKESVENHRGLDGSMFMGFLDASKAFDRLKHSLLFQKLIDCKVPGYITRIMITLRDANSCASTIPGYTLEHIPRCNSGGGVGVLFKDGLRLASSKPWPADSFECVEVVLCGLTAPSALH